MSDLLSKLEAYIKENNLSLTGDMPVVEDGYSTDDNGGKWKNWKHTGDFHVTIGGQKYHEYCKFDLPRAREQVLARIAQDFGL